MVAISALVPAGLPSPPEACQEEGMAEAGRSELKMQLLANVSSYTPEGDLALSFCPRDIFITTEELLTSMRTVFLRQVQSE